jgi:hypothetical protein
MMQVGNYLGQLYRLFLRYCFLTESLAGSSSRVGMLSIGNSIGFAIACQLILLIFGLSNFCVK